MSLNVQCVNEACRKTTEVPDEPAEQPLPCPFCGTALPVPEGEALELESDEEEFVEADEDVPEETDVEVIEEADIAASPVRKKKRKKKKAASNTSARDARPRPARPSAMPLISLFGYELTLIHFGGLGCGLLILLVTIGIGIKVGYDKFSAGFDNAQKIIAENPDGPLDQPAVRSIRRQQAWEAHLQQVAAGKKRPISRAEFDEQWSIQQGYAKPEPLPDAVTDLEQGFREIQTGMKVRAVDALLAKFDHVERKDEKFGFGGAGASVQGLKTWYVKGAGQEPTLAVQIAYDTNGVKSKELGRGDDARRLVNAPLPTAKAEDKTPPSVVGPTKVKNLEEAFAEIPRDLSLKSVQSLLSEFKQVSNLIEYKKGPLLATIGTIVWYDADEKQSPTIALVITFGPRGVDTKRLLRDDEARNAIENVRLKKKL